MKVKLVNAHETQVGGCVVHGHDCPYHYCVLGPIPEGGYWLRGIPVSPDPQARYHTLGIGERPAWHASFVRDESQQQAIDRLLGE